MTETKIYNAPGRRLLAAGVFFSILLGAFAVSNYRSSLPIAEGALRGLALTLASTIEALGNRDPSLALLHGVNSRDIAFFAVADPSGTWLFHTNPDLIGTSNPHPLPLPEGSTKAFVERRLLLGTGEAAYEFISPLHINGRQYLLRLVLHTYQADTVVRRARTDVAILLALGSGGWIMGIFLYRFVRRAAGHRQEMAKQKHLAQLGTLSAVLAHEVRNPLSGIKGYAQLLEEKLPPGENRSFAACIVREALRLEDLVRDLLSYARPPSLHIEAVDPREMVDLVFAVLRPEAETRQVRLECFVAPAVVRADRDHLQQVLLNLVLNAIQASKAGGTVQVRTASRPGTVEIEVIDNGDGIAPTDLPRLFEPFFTRRARGTGLGLAICKKFVEEMNGSIVLASAPGAGCTFRIGLPSAENTGGRA
jgi:two-component system sensor histidine kinase HydH